MLKAAGLEALQGLASGACKRCSRMPGRTGKIVKRAGCEGGRVKNYAGRKKIMGAKSFLGATLHA